MNRVALYGGSFDPPHVGHVMAVAWVLSSTDVDALWLVPCFQHAFGKPLSSYEHRREMCRLAVRPFDKARVAVNDVEARLGGTSRTIDTVQLLASEHPDVRFDVVVGADIFKDSGSWKRFDELQRLCRFLVLGREGYPSPEGVVTSPTIPDVSSTSVRERVRSGGDVSVLLPRDVAAYVAEHGLYR